MRFDSNTSTLHKHNHVFVKFAISFLLMGLAFRFYFSDSFKFSAVLEPIPLAGADPETESPLVSSPTLEIQTPTPITELKTESPAISFPNETVVISDIPLKENKTYHHGKQVIFFVSFFYYYQSAFKR